MGTSYICIGNNNEGPLAIGNACTSPFYDGGFIEVNMTGRYVYLYREEGNPIDSFYSIAEIDIYGTKNIAGSATVLTDYSPIVDSTFGQTYGANNLIENLNNRSHRWNMPPINHPLQDPASYNSCFRVDTSSFTVPYVFGLDHGFEKMQNAVLLVQDHLTNFITYNEVTELNDFYAALWDVHIGNSPEFD